MRRRRTNRRGHQNRWVDVFVWESGMALPQIWRLQDLSWPLSKSEAISDPVSEGGDSEDEADIIGQVVQQCRVTWCVTVTFCYTYLHLHKSNNASEIGPSRRYALWELLLYFQSVFDSRISISIYSRTPLKAYPSVDGPGYALWGVMPFEKYPKNRLEKRSKNQKKSEKYITADSC